MKERLEKLKALLDEIMSDSYADQYGIADFISDDTPKLQAQMDKLSKESAFYQTTLDQLDEI